MLGCRGRLGKLWEEIWQYGGVGGDVGKCVGVWGEIRKDVWGRCGKVYGVSGEVCWRVGKGCGEGRGGRCREMC